MGSMRDVRRAGDVAGYGSDNAKQERHPGECDGIGCGHAEHESRQRAPKQPGCRDADEHPDAGNLRWLSRPAWFVGDGSERLTTRECEILAMLGRGLRNPQIAVRLFVS